VQITIRRIVRLGAFLSLSGSLLACFDDQSATLEAKQYTAKAVKKTDNLPDTLFVPARDQKMLVKLGGFVFTLPSNWRDTSSYTYKSKERNVALTVSFGKTRDVITLEKFVAQRRQELSDSMGDDVEFLPHKRSEIANLPAIIQSFSFGDEANKYLEYWATAYYAENKYLTLSYVGPMDDKTLRSTFERITASGQSSSRPQPKQTTDHYLWRQADILRLQIPDYLQPPRYYTYVSPDGSLKLKVSLYNSGDSWFDNSLEGDAAKDLRFGGTPGIPSMKNINNVAIQQIAYDFQGGDPIEPTLFRAHRAQITAYGERLVLHIKGYASQVRQIDTFWLQFIADLIENSELNASPKADVANRDQG
jgi:hypothetical protein